MYCLYIIKDRVLQVAVCYVKTELPEQHTVNVINKY